MAIYKFQDNNGNIRYRYFENVLTQEYLDKIQEIEHLTNIRLTWELQYTDAVFGHPEQERHLVTEVNRAIRMMGQRESQAAASTLRSINDTVSSLYPIVPNVVATAQTWNPAYMMPGGTLTMAPINDYNAYRSVGGGGIQSAVVAVARNAPLANGVLATIDIVQGQSSSPGYIGTNDQKLNGWDYAGRGLLVAGEAAGIGLSIKAPPKTSSTARVDRVLGEITQERLRTTPIARVDPVLGEIAQERPASSAPNSAPIFSTIETAPEIAPSGKGTITITGTVEIAPAENVKALTAQLSQYTRSAVAHVDASEVNLFSQLSLARQAQYRRGEMQAALRGIAIEKYARSLIVRDNALMGQISLGRLNRGPDVLLRSGSYWWDFTTQAAWDAHLSRPASRGYIGIGNLLDTTK